MLESGNDPAEGRRPAPVDESWHPQSVDGVVGVRIASETDDDGSSSEWIWSSRWLDLAAKR